MRVDLALIVCGNRICEVITATLGPLPLDQLPKSKPVTPYAVSLIIPTDQALTSGLQSARRSASTNNNRRGIGIPGSADISRQT